MNMRKVAELAGVSSATVSRVINGSSLVREDTAEKVRRVIQQLDFIPNPHATILKYGRTYTYGVVIPDLANPFFLEFIKEFESLLVENDREILIANTDFHSTRTQQSFRRMLFRRVEGVALLTSESESAPFEELIRNRIPVVTSDRRQTAVGVSDVSSDYETGMHQAVRYLKDMGHSQIGFIGGTAGLVTSMIRRMAFINALKDSGLTFHEEFFRCGDYRVRGGEVAMNELLSSSRRPTAMVAINDLTAFGALRALHQRGIRIPEEMSVIGCDDLNISDIVNPPLTTLQIRRDDLANAFFRALQEADNDANRSGKQYSVQTTLIVRSSTGAAPRRTANSRKMRA